VVFHDPCYLGRHNGEFDAPRQVLQQLCGGAPLEMALSREKAMCCGAGGGRMWMEETIGRRINVLRVEQALPAAPKVIATACPYCAVMVADGLGAVAGAGDMPSRDIAELVAEAMVRHAGAAADGSGGAIDGGSAAAGLGLTRLTPHHADPGPQHQDLVQRHRA